MGDGRMMVFTEDCPDAATDQRATIRLPGGLQDGPPPDHTARGVKRVGSELVEVIVFATDPGPGWDAARLQDGLWYVIRPAAESASLPAFAV